MVLVGLWQSRCPETTEVGDGGRWWDGTDEVVVVVGCVFANTKWGRGLGAKNPKLSHCGLVEGGGGGSRLKWRRSRGSRSQTRAEGGGVWAKNLKPSARAWFQSASAQFVL